MRITNVDYFKVSGYRITSEYFRRGRGSSSIREMQSSPNDPNFDCNETRNDLFVYPISQEEIEFLCSKVPRLVTEFETKLYPIFN